MINKNIQLHAPIKIRGNSANPWLNKKQPKHPNRQDTTLQSMSTFLDLNLPLFGRSKRQATEDHSGIQAAWEVKAQSTTVFSRKNTIDSRIPVFECFFFSMPVELSWVAQLKYPTLTLNNWDPLSSIHRTEHKNPRSSKHQKLLLIASNCVFYILCLDVMI